MSLKIAICEDSSDDTNLLIGAIERSDIPANWDCFVSGEELLSNFIPGKYDLIFFDIYMEGLLGVEAAAKIRDIDTTVIFVFTTTSIGHTLESYRLKAPLYLEKPVKDEDVAEALAMAVERKKSLSYVNLFINGEKQTISLESIIYFEVRDHSVYVNTLTETFRTGQSIKLNHIEKMLTKNFLRCHYSYIVNLKYVKYLDNDLKTFIMHNGDIAYISFQLFKKSKEAYENYLFSKLQK